MKISSKWTHHSQCIRRISIIFRLNCKRTRGILPKINKHLCCCLPWRHLSKNADFSLAKRQGKEIDIAKQTNNFGAQNIYVEQQG